MTTQTLTPDTVLEVRGLKAQESYEQIISALVGYAERQILKKFKSSDKPIKVYGLVHPMTVPLTKAGRRGLAERLLATGWVVEYPTWRHPVRWANGTVLIRAVS